MPLRILSLEQIIRLFFTPVFLSSKSYNLGSIKLGLSLLSLLGFFVLLSPTPFAASTLNYLIVDLLFSEKNLSLPTIFAIKRNGRYIQELKRHKYF